MSAANRAVGSTIFLVCCGGLRTSEEAQTTHLVSDGEGVDEGGDEEDAQPDEDGHPHP